MGVMDQVRGGVSPDSGSGKYPEDYSSGGGGGGGAGGKFNLADYIQVQDRINEFYIKYPEGSILTFLASDPADWAVCRYRVEIRKESGQPFIDSTGWAFEIATGKSVNKTSHEENCETSAIGRALANLGFATTEKKRASREEMAKVLKMQEAIVPAEPTQQPREETHVGPPATAKQVNWIKGLWKELGYIRPDGHHDDGSLRTYAIEHWGVPLDQMTVEQASQLLESLIAADKMRQEALAEQTPEPVINDDYTLASVPAGEPF